MKTAWDAGLASLKPSAGDLEHGLELHRQSLVIDAYAFSPVSLVAPDVLTAAYEAGASPRERQEIIEHGGMTRHAIHPKLREEYLLAWETAGVTCIWQNAGEETQAPVQVLRRLANFTYATDMLKPHVQRAATPADIRQAREEGRHCLYFSSNAVPLVQEWLSVPDELSLIRTWFGLGVRMMHLTYNRRNMLGDGCMEAANAGLSDFGREAIEEMHRVGILLDVAHSGWQTSLDAARTARLPMVASHTVCTEVNMHPRGKPDEVIRAIADTDGYIGIAAMPGFLGGSGDLRALIDHADYAIRKFGSRHVAIGTDRAHQCRLEGEEEAILKLQRPKQRPMFHSLWSPDEPITKAHWRQDHMLQSTAWTNWPLITVGLVQRGHCDEAIADVLGGNVLRVAEAVMNGRDERKPD